MSKLPLELYRPIIDELESQSDFLALARTSKAFWSEVISKLYDAVTLGDNITTTLFLSTYQANPSRVRLVRDLTVRTTWWQFSDHTIDLVECINDMTSLKHLSINYPHTQFSLPFPRLINDTPWMIKLHLPHIHSLRLSFYPLISPFALFGTLPHPLPKLTTPGTVKLEALTDVATVNCFGTYQNFGLKQLVHLRHLKVYSFPDALSEFMPNLESLIFGGAMMRIGLEGIINARPFKGSLRMIGPISFRMKSESDIINLNASHMTNLRVVLLRVYPQLPKDLIISRFSTACPLLEHAIVIGIDEYLGSVTELEHYKRNHVNRAESWVLDDIIRDRHVLENWSDWALDLLHARDAEEPAPL